MIIDFTQFSYLILYFIVYSIIGWLLESVYKSIYDKKIVNSGFMFGPYCPIYGFGALIMILALERFKGNIILLFITSFVVLSIWEYGVGVYLEKVYNTKYWDYSKHKININGRVCLLNSIYWGILGVLFTLLINPIIEKYALIIPANVVIYIDIIVGVIMIVDFTMSNLKIHSIDSNIKKLKVMSEKIAEKKLKIKEENDDKLLGSDLNKLQLKRNRLKVQIYSQLKRMKRAFPTMKSDIGDKFLNGRIDVEELKKRIGEIKAHTKKLKESIKSGEETIDLENSEEK